jgi:hypothetical protein
MKQESKTFEIEFHLKPAVRAIDRPAGEKPKEGAARRRFDRYPRIVQVVALAIHFQDMLDRGDVRNHADLARLGCISRERMSQIMVLAWLAPDIQAEILSLPPVPRGYEISESKLRSIAKVASWIDQRRCWDEACGYFSVVSDK